MESLTPQKIDLPRMERLNRKLGWKTGFLVVFPQNGENQGRPKENFQGLRDLGPSRSPEIAKKGDYRHLRPNSAPIFVLAISTFS
ncbi:MAG: hypothetical protein LBR11_10590 [Deltaproteobacteria bacterium]|jgi:hypothetical protein|nr:hypothetical protein [Deltaproteobacteria bacterium]